MVEKWHERFSPERFLRRVNIDQFIKKNEAFNESKVDTLGQPCYICKGFQGPGILLNDKSYLCKSCFEKITSITYPEKYEKLYREFIREREARNEARELLINKCLFRKASVFFKVLGLVSLLSLLIGFEYVAIPIFFGLFYLFTNTIHEKKIRRWESKYPMPEKPKLRHFHDPNAELNQNDFLVLKIFNNWPGYPPFWGYLRDFTLNRDNHRCQVSGCPSRVALQVHHKTPVSQGGEHVPSNLVTLCDFHHSLEPTEGHGRIWGKIQYRYFTMVRAHSRRNPVTPGFHYVRAHVRRLELIDESELKDIIDTYGFLCPSCENQIESFEIDRISAEVYVHCDHCQRSWIGIRKLAEETGPRLAEIFIVSKNEGQWKPNWSMLEMRSKSAFRVFYSQREKI